MGYRETPLERDLRRLDSARDWFAADASGRSSYYEMLDSLYEKVQAARKAKGLLPFPYPPIPRGKRRRDAIDKILELAAPPCVEALPAAGQDPRIYATLRLEPLLELLSSPAFDKLSPSQQVAALFAD